MTATAVSDVARIQRPEARVIAGEEFRRYASCCASFTPDELLQNFQDLVHWVDTGVKP